MNILAHTAVVRSSYWYKTGNCDSLIIVTKVLIIMDVAYDNAIYEDIKAVPSNEGFNIRENNCYGEVASSANKHVHERKNSFYMIIMTFVIVFALLLGTAGACVTFALQVSTLKSEIALLQMASSSQNTFTDTLEEVGQDQNNSISMLHQQLSQQNASIDSVYQQLNEVSRQLNTSNNMLYQQLSQQNALYSAYQQLNTSNNMLYQLLSQQNDSTYELNEKVSRQLNMFYQQLSQQDQQLRQEYSALDNRTQQLNTSTQLLFSTLENYTTQYLLYPSCAALPPSSSSGYYWVRASDGYAVSVYCDMTRSCGGLTGGWMRVAELDMTNSSHQCPSGLMERSISVNIRTCVRNEATAGCSSVHFISPGVEYSSVCGRVIGYQYGAPEAFIGTSVDSRYVDGVSLTHGDPRQHIWTFAAANDEVGSSSFNCPCINTNQLGRPPPAFVGNDYFCDTGSEDRRQLIFYVDDPLWDGAGCGPLNTCCSLNTPPWFYKQLPQATTDDIEMRVCRDSNPIGNEDIAIEIVEVYVQ